MEWISRPETDRAKGRRTIAFVLVYPPSTAMPTFSVASSSPPLPPSPMRSAKPFMPPPISPQSAAASVQRFMSLRLTFSMLPERWLENLAVKASLSRKRWSGLCSGVPDGGSGRLANSASRSAFVGSDEAALSGFLGSSVTGGWARISDQGTFEIGRAHV